MQEIFGNTGQVYSIMLLSMRQTHIELIVHGQSWPVSKKTHESRDT